MNPDNTIGNLGIALGLLGANGRCIATVNDHDHVIHTAEYDGRERLITIDDVFLLLQAEEIR
jgi:YD repeat-containing protein